MSRLFIFMLVTENRSPDLYDRLLENNLKRQYDLLTNYIEIGIAEGPTSIDKYMLWALNHTAVAGICQFGGRFREEPIYVGSHVPPHYQQVPNLMDQFISFIHENWDNLSATQLAGYALWRLNWIHPFIEGNGRTARAISYYLLCTHIGTILPGTKIVPELIREHRKPYYQALQQTDQAWEQGKLDLGSMDELLSELLRRQLES